MKSSSSIVDVGAICELKLLLLLPPLFRAMAVAFIKAASMFTSFKRVTFL